MNKHHLALGLAIMLFASACRKTDAEIETAPVTAAATASEWKTAANWTAITSATGTSYQSKIQDSTITSAVAAEGLVLVYAKNAAAVEALPYTSKEDAAVTDWQYQVSEGSLVISAAVSGGASVKNISFNYFVITADQLKTLEQKGITKNELMQFSYDELKKNL